MRRFKLTLIAGENSQVPIMGDYFRVISGLGEFEIQPDTGSLLAGLQSGMAYTAKKTFKTLTITSKVTQKVEIMAGLGRIDDNRSSISGVVDISSKGEMISSAAHTVGTIVTNLAVFDLSRRSLIILNNSDGDIFIGDNSVTTANGLKITAGQTITIDKAAAAAVSAVGSAAGLDVRTFSELN